MSSVDGRFTNRWQMTIGDFSQQADAYGSARPGYPVGIVDQLLSDARVNPGDSVVDFGAGTGIFTRLLLDRHLQVAAVEPNLSMRAQANCDRATWIEGSFERCPLADESQSWAVAAQAFHWADPATALPEIHRVLRPQSVFSVLWNNRSVEDCAAVKWTEDAIRRHVPEFAEAYRQRSWNCVLESTGHFRMLATHVKQHVVSMSRDRYLALWRSHNRLNNIAGPERFDRFFIELSDYLDSNQLEQIDVVYNCEAWSAQRIDA